MNKDTVTKLFKSLRIVAKKHSPEILTGLGVAGMITTTILAVKATPKAMLIIEEKKRKMSEDSEEPVEKLTTLETVKVAWKPYIPAVITGVVSTACIVGANSVHLKRNAALATAYQLSTTALSEYKEKVIETIGEKKEKAIHDKIAKDKVENNPPSKSTVLVTGKGNTLCLDLQTGRYFESDIDKLYRVRNDLNYRMTAGMEMCISLNEFYNAIGLAPIPTGDDLGWRVDKGLIDFHISSQVTDDNRVCAVIEHLNPPEYGFNKVY